MNTCTERQITIRRFNREDVFKSRITIPTKFTKISDFCKKHIRNNSSETKDFIQRRVVEFMLPYLDNLNQDSSREEIELFIYMLRKFTILKEKRLFFIQNMEEKLKENKNISLFARIVSLDIKLYFKHHIGDYQDKDKIIGETKGILEDFFISEGMDSVTFTPFISEMLTNYLLYSYYISNTQEAKSSAQEFEKIFLNKYKNFQGDLRILKAHQIYIELLLGEKKTLEGLMIRLNSLKDKDEDNEYIRAVSIMAHMLYKTNMKIIKATDILDASEKKDALGGDPEFEIDFSIAVGEGFLEIARSFSGIKNEIQKAIASKNDIDDEKQKKMGQSYLIKARESYSKALDVARGQENGLLKIRPIIRMISIEKSELKRVELFWEAFEAFNEHLPIEVIKQHHLGKELLRIGVSIFFRGREINENQHYEEIIKKYKNHIEQQKYLLEGISNREFSSEDEFWEAVEKYISGFRIVILERDQNELGISIGFPDFDFMKLNISQNEGEFTTIGHDMDYAKKGLFSNTLVCQSVMIGPKNYIIFADRGENSNRAITQDEMQNLIRVLSIYIKTNEKRIGVI